MIELKSVSFNFGDTPVLKGVSFKIEPRTVNFVLGANGAGKTTMFRCLLGLLDGYGGFISVGGDDIKKLSPGRMARLIAYIPQAHSSVFAYTALDMTLMGTGRTLSPFASPGKKERDTAMRALEKVGIARLAERPVHFLSGGELQLVMIARALAQQTKILIMDEPTSSLDYGNQLLILQGVRDLAKEGYTVLVSSHNPQHAITYADRILVLQNGVVAADGKPGDVINEGLLKSVYGVDVHIVSTDYGVAVVPESGYKCEKEKK